jgi:hypothetical protein
VQNPLVHQASLVGAADDLNLNTAFGRHPRQDVVGVARGAQRGGGGGPHLGMVLLGDPAIAAQRGDRALDARGTQVAVGAEVRGEAGRVLQRGHDLDPWRAGPAVVVDAREREVDRVRSDVHRGDGAGRALAHGWAPAPGRRSQSVRVQWP